MNTMARSYNSFMKGFIIKVQLKIDTNFKDI
jgi:hypothetical protein